MSISVITFFVKEREILFFPAEMTGAEGYGEASIRCAGAVTAQTTQSAPHIPILSRGNQKATIAALKHVVLLHQ